MAKSMSQENNATGSSHLKGGYIVKAVLHAEMNARNLAKEFHAKRKKESAPMPVFLELVDLCRPFVIDGNSASEPNPAQSRVL